MQYLNGLSEDMKFEIGKYLPLVLIHITSDYCQVYFDIDFIKMVIGTEWFSDLTITKNKDYLFDIDPICQINKNEFNEFNECNIIDFMNTIMCNISNFRKFIERWNCHTLLPNHKRLIRKFDTGGMSNADNIDFMKGSLDIDNFCGIDKVKWDVNTNAGKFWKIFKFLITHHQIVSNEVVSIEINYSIVEPSININGLYQKTVSKLSQRHQIDNPNELLSSINITTKTSIPKNDNFFTSIDIVTDLFKITFLHSRINPLMKSYIIFNISDVTYDVSNRKIKITVNGKLS